DEVIVLSTRRDTKKYQLVKKAPNVAILVHDFGGSSGDRGKSEGASSDGDEWRRAITLNGPACIQEGEKAEVYRSLHLQNNPGSKTFIVGPNIAIITVQVQTARTCDIKDRVKVWRAAESGDTPATVSAAAVAGGATAQTISAGGVGGGGILTSS
ncbi:unnamed protein product, partial [Discosporangium mesarthrocarpum]